VLIASTVYNKENLDNFVEFDIIDINSKSGVCNIKRRYYNMQCQYYNGY